MFLATVFIMATRKKLFPSCQGICLVFFRVDVLPAQLLTRDDPRGLRWLSQDERHRLERYRGDDKQLQFLASRLRGRLIISTWAQCSVDEISWSAYGPPEIKVRGVKLNFGLSLTHSHGMGVWALSNELFNLGVDLEATHQRGCCGWARTFLTREEQSRLETATESARERLLLEYWTIKESAYKCLWRQRPCQPADLHVTEFPDDDFRVQVPLLGKQLNAHVLHLNSQCFGERPGVSSFPQTDQTVPDHPEYCCALAWEPHPANNHPYHRTASTAIEYWHLMDSGTRSVLEPLPHYLSLANVT